MSYRVHLTRVSANKKTGPIPVSTTEASTCPPTCAQYDTCYAKFGPLGLHWKAVNDGKRGMDWDEFCEEVSCLRPNKLWRHNQAGDLPGDGVNIDVAALSKLVTANMGRRGFTYTHYPLVPENLRAIEAANDGGFTVNISCDSLTDSDFVSQISRAPQVVVLPSTTTEHALYTPAGRKVVVCPATYRDDIDCSICGACADRSLQRAVIGFPAHGMKKRVIDLKLIRDTS